MNILTVHRKRIVSRFSRRWRRHPSTVASITKVELMVIYIDTISCSYRAVRCRSDESNYKAMELIGSDAVHGAVVRGIGERGGGQ